MFRTDLLRSVPVGHQNETETKPRPRNRSFSNGRGHCENQRAPSARFHLESVPWALTPIRQAIALAMIR